MLPREFLSQIADKYGFPQDQKEVFLEKFGNDKNDQEIMDACHISDGTLRYRLGKIYTKFRITGKGPGKAHKLLTFLTTESQKFTALVSPSSNASETDAEPTQKKQQDTNEIDVLVQEVRQKRHEKIQYQCATMRMLDIAQPVALSDIYIDVNILEQITSLQWREISDLLQGFNPEADNFDRLGLSGVGQLRVPGLDAASRYSKLMVLGKPGSGKTTFLQWIAIKCDLGEFQANRVPIFIRLKNFAEDTKTDNSKFRLLNYISQEFSDCGIADKSVLEMVLTQGKALILLDGLDEVTEADEFNVVTHIRRFSEKYFKNQFIITCRIAAQKYKFQGFTDVEVADFNFEQVEAFANKWFMAVARNNREEREAIARRFIEKLNLPTNQQIRELVVTPILLNLTCLVFQGKGEFPSNRSKLYEQGLDILLSKWDESKGIRRDEVYRNLSVQNKIELLSQVAAITFEKNLYFFEQGEGERCIANYLRTLPNAQSDRAILQRNSKAVLKSLEAQHGLLVERAREIYSFSHLTFQEYFTAREIISIVIRSDIKAFTHLLTYKNNKRWREVFCLVPVMPWDADSLMGLKQLTDKIMADDKKLQEFIIWLRERTVGIIGNYKPVAIRAFYFAPNFALDQNFDIPLYNILDFNIYKDFTLTLDRALNHSLMYALYFDTKALIFDLTLAIERASSIDTDLNHSLQQLKRQFSDAHSQGWTAQLRRLMIKHRSIGHDWQFNQQQKKLIKQYYDANKLLVECLNSSWRISDELRQEIEDTLLLPIA